MKPRALLPYIKYLWHAKKLHGVHSPFVYTFSERILYSRQTPKEDLNLPEGLFTGRYRLLPALIKEHYQYNIPLLLDTVKGEQTISSNFIIISDPNPGNWVQLFNKYRKQLPADCVLIIPSIHNSQRHAAKWRRLHTHPRILLSIDLFGVGVVFFRKEFKEKQHFVLKY